MPSPFIAKAALGVCAASLIAAQVQAQAQAQVQARVGEVCLELPAGANVVKAQIASGCLPTSPNHKGAFTITVTAETATIAINGGYKPVREHRISSADCMGRQVIAQEAKATGPRRYSVKINGAYSGVIDASDTLFGTRAVKRCFANPRQIASASPDRVTTYARSQFEDWIGPNVLGPGQIDKPGKPLKPPFTAPTLGELAARILGNHPEAEEGRPSAQIIVSPARWRRLPLQKLADTRFMAIQIEEHGYADDSVSGRRTFASAKQHPQTGEWRATGVWRQYMCARGNTAGQWSAKPCS